MCKAKSSQYTPVKDANYYKFNFLLGPQMVAVYPLKVIKNNNNDIIYSVKSNNH